MRKLTILILVLFFICSYSFAQEEKSIKSNPDEKSSIEKINSTETIGDEILFKNDNDEAIITFTDEGSNVGSITLPSPPTGVGFALPSTNKLYNHGGILHFNGSPLGSGGATQINDLSDAKTDATCVFLGNGSGANDDGSTNYNTSIGIEALYSNTVGYSNTAIGYQSLNLNLAGLRNTAVGYQSLLSNKGGSWNTANGFKALFKNTEGNSNSANGYAVLYSNIAGNNNTGNGYQALFNNRGSNNTATGYNALFNNTGGSNNTATGFEALYSNTMGSYNTAHGYQALYSNTDEEGEYNTAVGYQALFSNAYGIRNTAIGYQALFSNNGWFNTAIGYLALGNNAGGMNNTANGHAALIGNKEGDDNVGCGEGALAFNATGNGNSALGRNTLIWNESGSNNTGCGFWAGPPDDPNGRYSSLTNSTAIGAHAVFNGNNQVRIGNSSVTSIGGYSDWTNFSDIRYKQNIREDVGGLDFIMGLRPITYNLNVEAIAGKLGEDISLDENQNTIKREISSEVSLAREIKSSIRKSGFSAQEVEELANRLGYDFGGVDKPENDDNFYGLRYAEFVVPLVKAVQEQQKMIADQQIIIAEILKEIEELKRR
jgi:hypothetical protein